MYRGTFVLASTEIKALSHISPYGSTGIFESGRPRAISLLMFIEFGDEAISKVHGVWSFLSSRGRLSCWHLITNS